MKKTIVSGLLALASGWALAQATPAGLWKTIDDETKEARSHVRITDQGGVFTGRIEKLLDPARQDARCDKCDGPRHGQPVLGLAIIEGVRKNADEPYWDGGQILDPNNGKTYKVRLTPQDGGKALQVRGFIGPFFRNQQWIRVE